MSAVLEKNFIKCLSFIGMLFALSQGKEISGYESMKQLEAIGFKVSSGTVYYQLNLLERNGFVEKYKKDRRFVYSMTEAGLRAFQSFREKFRAPVKLVNDLMGSL